MADDDNGEDDHKRGLTKYHDQYTWRGAVMRELDDVRRRLEALEKKFVSKELFTSEVGPIKKVMWLVFSVVTSALVMAVMGLLLASGKVMK